MLPRVFTPGSHRFHVGVLPLLMLSCAAWLPAPASAQFVDSSFNAPIHGANALALQPDGRLIVGGVSHINGTPVTTRIVRLLTNGAIDPTFNTPIAGSTVHNTTVTAVELDSIGRVLVEGTFTIAGVNARMARLLPDGAIDPTFTPLPAGPRLTSGVTSTGAERSTPSGTVVQPDGRILHVDGFRLQRFNPDGTNDATFTPFPLARCATLLPDGRILAGGSFFLNGETRNLVRLLSNGTLDPTFDLSTPITPLSTIDTIAVRPDGRILAAGGFVAGGGYPIRQFSADGTPDMSFDVVALGSSTIDALVLEPDGSVLVAGWFSAVNGQPMHGMARLNASGVLDLSFAPFPQVAAPRALARLDDGRIYVAGSLGDRPSVVRVFPAATTTTPPGSPALTAAHVASNPVRFTWSPGVGSPPASYDLQVGSRTGASDIGVFPMGLATSIEANAPPMLRLYLRVVARNAQGSAVSNELTFILGGVSPPSPPVLTATQVAVNPISLAWGSPRGPLPQSYTLVAGSASGQADLGTFPMGLATSVTANAPMGMPVFVRVIATNTGGSAASDELTFTVSPPTAPPAPSLNPAGGTGQTVTLSWSGSPGSSYAVVARLVAGGPLVATLPVSTTAVSIPGVPSGTYVVSVVAIRGGLSSPESNSISVVVPHVVRDGAGGAR